ncbi:PTS sugar transporter subunit IIA [Senegalia massiliensis]|uniref:PTS sugar transporter subunit IIA n=1 Tax=Senegalia massiliensis TaxID=1720316 RepID=A0A845QX23_9CLOT|nr:PTS sugar transporter subunit IIA [Senegalia massiliensis]NBI07045.1 PTS sugar transporter subunit IIA [Senegalia massiliensis]
MKNTNVIDINNIIFTNKFSSKQEAILKLSELLVESQIVIDKQKFIEDIFERENRGSTFVGENLAIPHGFSNQVKKPSIAIARVDNPFLWDENDNKVKLTILFAIPEDDEMEEESEVLKKIAAALGDEDLIKDLLNAHTKEKLIYILKDYINL